ncbi:Glucose-1-phosphate adenylyltransferase large subunit [Hibiscus syriacus]|uniref:glucose-1-phosphate adenylyltransferase n=1 Tax=Hibiscus syriacus TaxID=106335 RepID=A0A6A2WQA1_HIBSY|nr:Glucose-1-phosphate adenylyltransferase large subunit [Hibiscus syriacus]
MESLCMSLKANASPIIVSKGRSNGGTVFWGETIRGCLKSRDFGSQLWKSLRAENGVKKAEVGVVYSILSPKINKETLNFEAAKFETPEADPKKVASIILGGGAGTRLFPLTRKRAKPAVPIGGCYRLIDIPMSNSRTYNLGNGVNFGDGFVEVLAATQTPGEAGKKWFQGTADAVRQFVWVFEDARAKNVEHVLILSGDHLYRADYMDFVQRHIDSNADITVSCLPMDDSRASDYGLMKIDGAGRIVQFAEKPKGPNLKAMQVDTSILGLSAQDAARYPYIASMGVYVFKTSVLLKLLTRSYPSCNDFGSEIIPSAVEEHNAYLFNDYWEDIGTIKSFFDANLALTEQPSKFQFYDPKTPFYTSPRFLPPTKVDKCRIVDSIISHGCFLRECSVQHSIVGVRSRLESGVELEDTMMMGADYYQTESEIASLLADGKVPIGVGQNTKIKNCIIDKNAKIGKDVIISNADAVEEAERPEDEFYIRSGITVILKNATIRDGTII